MDVREFKALPWRRQNDVLEPVVVAALRKFDRPIPTKRLMVAVAHQMGWLDRDLKYVAGAGPAIAAVLKRFQQHKPGLAVHDGEEFEFAGKTYRRWMWQPQKDEAEALFD